MKKMNKTASGVLWILLLCLLVFFSRTVYYYRLPEVRGVRPFRGFLNKMEISSGIADWAELDTIYAAISGTVDTVFVKEGDTVQAGQPLFQMRFDVEDAERKLREIRNNSGKLQNDINYTTAKLETIRQALKEAETGGVPEIREEFHPDLISLDLNKARMALKEAELSYELGAKSRYDLETARNNLRALFLKYKSDEGALQFDLEAKKIDLQNLLLQEESCRDTLEDYRAYSTITAPAAGVIVSLEAKRGMYIQEKNPLVSIGTGGEFTVECTVSLENNFVIPGDSCELSNSSRTLEGTVSRVKPSDRGKTVSVTVRSDEVTGEISPGESFDIVFEKNSSAAYTLVPNAALNHDNDGYFLNQIKRRKGILGEEYYTERLDVYIGDSDRTNTVIIRGITFLEPVVLRSTRPVVSGSAVSLVNPGDFFEQ